MWACPYLPGSRSEELLKGECRHRIFWVDWSMACVEFFHPGYYRRFSRFVPPDRKGVGLSAAVSPGSAERDNGSKIQSCRPRLARCKNFMLEFRSSFGA